MVFDNSGFEQNSSSGFQESPSNALNTNTGVGMVSPTQGSYMASLAGDGFAITSQYYAAPPGYNYLALDMYASFVSQTPGDGAVWTIGCTRQSDGGFASYSSHPTSADPDPDGIADRWRTYVFPVSDTDAYRPQFGNDLPWNSGDSTMYIDNIRWLEDLTGLPYEVQEISPYT